MTYGRIGKFGRFCLAVLGWLVKLLFPFEVRGLENVPKEGGFILASNHISLMDPVYLFLAQPHDVYFMGKEELFKSKFGAWFLGKQCGCFPVQRGKGDIHALDIACEQIENNHVMGIFPEGTRSRTGNLLRFKSGTSVIASRTGANILPASIVTKNQKVRMFRKTIVSFGKLLTQEELGLLDEKPNIRVATRKMTSSVESLMEASK